MTSRALSDDRVASAAAGGAACAVSGVEAVVARAADEPVASGTADDEVGTGAAEQVVVAAVAEEVVTPVADQPVRAAEPPISAPLLPRR